MTYFKVAEIIFLVLLAKYDLIKDIQVAATFTHANTYYAYLFWASINVPFWGILLYHYLANKVKEFPANFLGFAELQQSKEEKEAGTFIGVVSQQ